jgi:pyruvate dehydrogenase (quinone)
VTIVVLPGDFALQEAASNRPFIPFEQHKARVCPSKEEITRLAEILNSARKVTILGGAGCAGAHSELVEIACLLQAPIVHAMRGKEFIEYDNPYDVGMTGLLGFSSGYHAMMDSDLLLMLGTDFPYQQFYPPRAYIVQVDIRGEQTGRRTKIDLGLVGDVRETLAGLKPLFNQKRDKRHLRASLNHYFAILVYTGFHCLITCHRNY